MPRKQATSLEEIASAAVVQLSRHGFRQTQMADIARSIGISAGTLYLYVENKEALLSLATRFLLGEDGLNDAPLPFRAEPRDALIGRFMEKAAQLAQWPRLDRARAEQKADKTTLEEIGTELFALMAQHRRSVWFLDSMAAELPEVAPIHVDHVRGRVLSELTDLLIEAGGSKLQRDAIMIIARGALEIMSWSAMHRHIEGLAKQSTGDLSEAEIGILASRAFAAALGTATDPRPLAGRA